MVVPARARLVSVMVALAAAACGGSAADPPALPPTAEASNASQPPTPFEDVGACPFEGCVYREWIARRVTPVRERREAGAPVAFELKRGDKVEALTGTVVITQPGLVDFTAPWQTEVLTVQGAATRLAIEPGDQLFVLTYEGEGFSKVWFEGQVFTGVDLGAIGTAGTVRRRPSSVWWVQVRDQRGQVGWTDRAAADFANKDAKGTTFEDEEPDEGLNSGNL